MNENNKPIIKFNNGTIGVAVFEQTHDTEYGPRKMYSCTLRKGVKNKQTGEWDEYKIALFEDQILPAMELLRMAHDALIVQKSGTKHDATPTTEPGDDVPF